VVVWRCSCDVWKWTLEALQSTAVYPRTLKKLNQSSGTTKVRWPSHVTAFTHEGHETILNETLRAHWSRADVWRV